MKTKLIKKIKIESWKIGRLLLDRRESKCYLEEQLDIEEKKEFERFLIGKTIYVYKFVDINVDRLKKCMWCGKIPLLLEDHIKKEHRKTKKNMKLYKIQEELYQILLKKHIRKGKYWALAFLPYGCQMCDHPGLYKVGKLNRCTLETSPKNKIRSWGKLFDLKSNYGIVIS